jgi:hypothetical protein
MKGLGRLALVGVAVLAWGALASAGETRVARGKVKAVSDTAVAVVGDDGEEWTFDVAPGARVYGAGASHKAQLLASSGRPTTMDDFVREGQWVAVHYTEQDGRRTLHRLRFR